MTTTATVRARTRAPHAVLAVLAVAGLALLAAAGWMARPSTLPGTEPKRLLPPVARPAGDATTPMRRPETGGAAVVWDTRRGYPVPVEHRAHRWSRHGPAAPYSWLLADGDSGEPPARWSPCSPLVVRVNPTGFDHAARAAIRWAFRGLETSTGLDVRFGADTTETVTGRLSGRTWTEGTWSPSWRRRWAPVLVLASDAGRTPELAGPSSGWTHVHTDGDEHLVSGVVALDVEDLAGTDRGAARLRMLLLHELGHLVGLGHTEDPHLVMHEYVVPAADEEPAYRHGDRLGLAAAGRGPC